MSTIIHIGFHKSASTYLQKLFSESPVKYLFFAGPRREALNAVQKNKFDPEPLRSWVEEELEAKYRNSSYGTTILSHEELSGHPHGYRSVSGRQVAQNLKQLYPNAKILIIVRSQVDYLLSLYAFRVAIKGYESRSLETFIKEEGRLGLFQHLKYDSLIKCYRDLFGVGSVLVLPVELLKDNPEEFHRQLFEYIGVTKPTSSTNQPLNESTRDLLVLSIWRRINYLFGLMLGGLRSIFKSKQAEVRIDNFRFAYYGIRASITRALGRNIKFGGSLDAAKPSIISSLIEEFDASNKELEQLTGYPLATMGYPTRS